jgi:hypothetical protein
MKSLQVVTGFGFLAFFRQQSLQVVIRFRLSSLLQTTMKSLQVVTGFGFLAFFRQQ